MGAPLPADLLQRSPEEASRLVVLALLDAAAEAAARLDDPEDAEALHDFRVAIRRTRSVLRAWKDALGKSVRKGDRKAFRTLQRATGEGRDAQVALAWLAEQRAELRPPHRLGADWLAGRLQARRDEALEHACRGVREGFEAVRAGLEPRLEVVTVRKNLKGGAVPSTYGEALAVRAREAADEVVRLLSGVTSVEDRDTCHRARVAGKRLRYLVEPARGHVEAAQTVVKRCKKLQDLLGDLNDAHVQCEALGRALEEAAAERARRLHELARATEDDTLRREARRSERAGLLALTRRAQLRLGELWERLERDWLAGGMVTLLEDVEALVEQLESACRPPVEIERKYLLRGRPDLEAAAASGARVDAVEIDQGWLPGERLRERLRRSVGPNGTTYTRTVKVGAGVERLELDEATSAPVFDTLWPLTEGCRIRKRRHRVRAGDHLWEVDEFLDRDLWLAEVELDDPDAAPDLPQWLAGQVEREVTDDPRYTNLKLAR